MIFTTKRHRSRLLILFLSLFAFTSLLGNIYFLWDKKKQQSVSEVVDGDTFQLVSGKRIRLLGVDAPELSRCGGTQAKETLSSLVAGRSAKMTEETEEAFGRTMALVWVDGVLINERMLSDGWGRPDYRKNSYRDSLTRAFHEAQTKKVGIWSDICRKKDPSGECSIKGNIDKATYEKTYHVPGCRYYADTIIELDRGEKYFCSEQEAEDAGFKKSLSCP